MYVHLKHEFEPSLPSCLKTKTEKWGGGGRIYLLSCIKLLTNSLYQPSTNVPSYSYIIVTT